MKRYTQSGAAAVEFALVLPLLLLIVFGIIEFSIGFYDKAVITNASREAARAGIVQSSPKPTVSDIQNVAINYCNQNQLVTFAKIAPAVLVTVSSTPNSFGDPLTVTVSYSYRGLALGSLLSVLGKPMTLTATTVMLNE